jgi:deoxyribonuclease-4
MLIGAHVSPAGGLVNAVSRGAERKASAIQIFNQNPRAWKPRVYEDEEVAAYREAAPAAGVHALLIHAVYLLNCASEDPLIRERTVTSLVSSLRAGAALGAHAVVLHPGSALKGGDAVAAVPRAGAAIAEALAESEDCPLHLENTAGAGGTLGRSFEQLAALIESAGGDERLGVCLDSCHMLASGYEIRTPEALSDTLDEADRTLGAGVVRSLHLNDSIGELGSNRDRHANLGKGELGRAGCSAWLSEPRFEDLPCVLETPGSGGGPEPKEIALAKRLRKSGQRARAEA